MNRHPRAAQLTSVLATALLAVATGHTQWLHYGGDAGGSHYSPLSQLTPANVGRLEEAWRFSAGEVAEHPERRAMMGFNGTPILLPPEAGQSLVTCTALNRIVALDPVTGAERWRYDAQIELGPPGNKFLCRGVAYWRDPQAPADAACAHSVYMGTKDLRLVRIDARNGRPCSAFGEGGEQGLATLIADGIPDLNPGDLQFSAPPVVIADTVIMGFADNTKFWRADNPRGGVRAFDARTGELRWSFAPEFPRPDSDAKAARPAGGANVWSMMSVDYERNLVFLPTATAGPNNYGGLRSGNNKYANSVVALEATTGEVRWHYQIVHHDVWDLDLPAQPILVDIRHAGRAIPVVIQLTKQGLVFVLHRDTGQPVFPVEERPVPTDGVPGEKLAPTQPFPVAPAPLVDIGITADDAWGMLQPFAASCRESIAGFRTGGLYEPVDLQGRASLPGLSVNNWGGASFDPESNLLVLPINRSPMFLKLWVTATIPPEVMNQPRLGPLGPPTPMAGTPYAYQMGPLLSPIMTPCTAPPWGELAALDMDDGSIRWRRPLGTLDKLARMPLPLEWGTPLAGGPISTAGGLTFIGATADERFRAFETRTGALLWEAATPSAAMATPMTYEVDGRQFVLVYTGGHMFMYSQNIADYMVAFALPAGPRPSER